MEVDPIYSDFDSEVLALINDLGLVLKGSPKYLYWLSVIANSQYYRYHFCDRYKDFKENEKRSQRIRLQEMYKSFRKGSRYTLVNELCVQDRLL